MAFNDFGRYFYMLLAAGVSGQWKRLRSRMGHALDDDDDGVRNPWLALTKPL